jgi:hypothetical protein
VRSTRLVLVWLLCKLLLEIPLSIAEIDIVLPSSVNA